MGSTLSSEKNSSQEPDINSNAEPDQERKLEPSLYDILSLEPTANEQELKKAYKKHALRLHPDRNFQNIEEATKEFAKIQSAYDVLSDPQERAWYDSHTLHADMTKGQETNLAGYTILTTSEDLQKYFDPMLYSTLKNHESDFLSLSELFSNLGYEERELAISFGEKPAAWSLFGNSGSEWKHTKIFYERWTSFSTIKDFYWCDVYRVSDAPDSKTQREMMGLNQRYRDLAKKEYNDTVRSLVKFIKKRDPRVKLVRSEAYEKQNTQNSDSKIQAAKDRHQNKIKLQENVYTEQNWTKTPERKYQPSRSHDSLEILDLENTDDEVINLFECLVCQKKFKTKQQYDGHEKSKKHIKALKNLRWELKKDGLDMVTEVDHLVCKDTGHNNGDWQENNGTEQVMHNSTYVDDPTQSYDHRSDSVLSFCSGSDSPENTDSEPEKHKPLPSTDRTKPDSLANMKKITVTIDGLLNEIESIDKRGFGDSNITEVSVHSQPKKDRRKRKTKK